ncbi:MAG: recombinase family protein [Nocardioides alkalitolerans]
MADVMRLRLLPDASGASCRASLSSNERLLYAHRTTTTAGATMYVIGRATNGTTHAAPVDRLQGDRSVAACRRSIAVTVRAGAVPARDALDVTCGRCQRTLRALPNSPEPAPSIDDTRPLGLAYIRVSTEGQVEHGVSLDAQRASLLEAGERRGYRVEVVADEGWSGKNMRRPGLQAALARLDAGDAAALLAVRIDRLSRSVLDFANLLARADSHGWALVMLSPDIDTSDPSGRFSVNVLVAAAEYERQLISQRTREGLARRRAQGVRLGRPSALPPEVVQRILGERHGGASLRAIADRLNGDEVPTGQGGRRWHASSVSAVLATASRATAVGS